MLSAAAVAGPPHQTLFSLAFSPDGRSVAAAGSGPAAYVWDTVSGKLTAVFRDPSGAWTSSLAYSPDGRTLAVSDYEGNIYLWNVDGLP
jgi:WD40 repeat protein